jgi:hypothetical protein
MDWKHLIPDSSTLATLKRLGMRPASVMPANFYGFSLARKLAQQPGYLALKVMRDRRDFEL